MDNISRFHKSTMDRSLSIGNIRFMERFLAKNGEPLTPKEEILKKYGLKKKNNLFVGDSDYVFKVMCKKFKFAKNYKNYGDLYNSWRNGFGVRTTPVTVMKKTQPKRRSLVPKFRRNDDVWILELERDGFHLFQATVLASMVEKLSDGSSDVKYELKSPCYGMKSGFKFQSGSIYKTREEAEKALETRRKNA